MTGAIRRSYDIRLNLRHALREFGRRSIAGDPVLDARGDLAEGRGEMQADQGAMRDGVIAGSVNTDDLRPFVENLDPWRTRIPRVGRNAFERLQRNLRLRRAAYQQAMDPDLPLRVRLDILMAGRQLQPTELREVREEVQAQQLNDHHQRQAELGRHRIIGCLTRLGFCHLVQREGSEIIKERVQIRYIEFNPMYYRYFVDAASLPWKVKLLDMASDSVCTDLSAACGHPVRAEIKQIDNTVIGLQYTLEIAATMGVPNVCNFSDLLPLMPASAAPLSFLTGYSEGKRLRYANLEDMPHFLGGGQTNGGKSNMMHNIVCSLLSRNTPDQLRLLMIDLKFNGIEMARYKGIPHLIAAHDLSKPGTFVPAAPSGIATVAEEANDVLRWVLREADRRGKMFSRSEAQNLRQWNRKHPGQRLPYIVIIIDELAQLRLNKEYGTAAYDLLQTILSTARAAGISIVAFTQSSNSKVIDEFIKINLPGRICFSVPDAPSSILFVGNGGALGLMPAGRGIFKHGTQVYTVQTPLVSPSDIADVVGNAKLGKLTGHLSARPVTPEEVIAWAVEHNQSSLAVRDVYRHFGSELQRIEKNTGVEMLLKEMEGRDYRVGENVYQVLPSIGNRPRVLIRLDMANAAPAAQVLQDRTQDAARRCEYCGTASDDPDVFTCAQCGAPM